MYVHVHVHCICNLFLYCGASSIVLIAFVVDSKRNEYTQKFPLHVLVQEKGMLCSTELASF